MTTTKVPSTWIFVKITFRLKLNATYEGSFMLPAVHCEDMYNNEIFYVVPARQVVVR